MKVGCWLVLVLLSLAPLTLAGVEPAGVQWLSPDQAAELKGNTKLYLYDFTAAWCGPCKMLEKEVFMDPAIALGISQAFVPVRVMDRMREARFNPPKVSALQRLYAIKGFPTLLVDKYPSVGKGRSLVGYHGKEETRRFLQTALQDLGGSSQQLKALERHYQSQGKPALLRRLATGQVLDLDEKEFYKGPRIYLGPEDKRKVVQGALRGPQELSGEIFLVLGDQALYVMAKIFQGRPPFNEEMTDRLYLGDSVEVWISSVPDDGKLRSAVGPQDYYFTFAPKSENGQPVFYSARKTGVSLRASTREQGYSIAASIPLSNLPGHDWQVGKSYRFDCAINKGGTKGHRTAKLFWHSESDMAYESPDLWGQAVLQVAR